MDVGMNKMNKIRPNAREQEDAVAAESEHVQMYTLLLYAAQNVTKIPKSVTNVRNGSLMTPKIKPSTPCNVNAAKNNFSSSSYVW